jgi:hypothetical protein
MELKKKEKITCKEFIRTSEQPTIIKKSAAGRPRFVYRWGQTDIVSAAGDPELRSPTHRKLSHANFLRKSFYTLTIANMARVRMFEVMCGQFHNQNFKLLR